MRFNHFVGIGLSIAAILLLSACAKKDFPVNAIASNDFPVDQERFTNKYKDQRQKEIGAITSVLNSGSKNVPDFYFAKRGELYLKIRQYEESLDDLKASIPPDPSLASIVQEALSEPEESIQLEESAIRYRKRQGSSWQDLRARRAALAALLEKPDQVIDDVDNLIELGFADEHNNYRHLKAFALINKGDYEGANKLIKQVLDVEPLNRTAYYLGCRLNLARGESREALSDAHALVAMNLRAVDRYATPIDVAIFQLRAMVFAALNKPERVYADLHMADLISKQNKVPESVSGECANILASAGNSQAARLLIKQEKERLAKVIVSLNKLEQSLNTTHAQRSRH